MSSQNTSKVTFDQGIDMKLPTKMDDLNYVYNQYITIKTNTNTKKNILTKICNHHKY